MRITRLPKIRNCRVFRDFTWPEDLHDFAQFNVIYGSNGSGKTTLSFLFENLQDKCPVSNGDVVFALDDGGSIAGNSIADVTVPQVRVFNRDFVARTIEAIGESNVAPIYYLGKESIEKQKQIESLRADLQKAVEASTEAESRKRKAEQVLDDFCIEKAKLIKEALLGSAEHATYDKRRFRQAVARIKAASSRPQTLSDKEKEAFRKQKELRAKATIRKISAPSIDIDDRKSRVLNLLSRSVVSQVIADLATDPAVGAWVQQGLSLHKGDHETDTCRFCGNEFSARRRAELEAHFNDAFASFQGAIEQEINEIDRLRQSLEAVAFPDVSRFYENLVEDADSVIADANEAIRTVSRVLVLLKEASEKKKANPFELLSLKGGEPKADSPSRSLSASITAVNSIIDKHESITGNLTNEIKQACSALEQDYVLEAVPHFDELEKSVTDAKTALDQVQGKPAEIRKNITSIERNIIEHRRPAEELNRELRAYLGRDELIFEIKETGYALSRGGQPASDLSEGERTAIAFLYFLKTLEDKDFDLSKGVVVIDDPVSSLDANALFSAFGYMKERTKNCHQLFILTHNFAFFRQVKNWFHYMKGQNKKNIAQRPARFYSLHTMLVDGKRNAVISRIDPLLEEYESEYHFLFRQVHEAAIDATPVTELVQFYGMPNVARRLVETFLAYRFPDCSGDLFKRFERVDYDGAKKTRILRLLNTYSHSGGISDPEHDPSVLSETREVMKIVMDMIQTLDNEHYQGMVNLLQPDEMDG
jgi:wobble nucleotide-excising tRNase